MSQTGLPPDLVGGNGTEQEREMAIQDNTRQTELRNALTVSLLDAMNSNEVNPVEAYVACIGAAAIVLATLPFEARKKLVEATEGTILLHANKRAEQIHAAR